MAGMYVGFRACSLQGVALPIKLPFFLEEFRKALLELRPLCYFYNFRRYCLTCGEKILHDIPAQLVLSQCMRPNRVRQSREFPIAILLFSAPSEKMSRWKCDQCDAPLIDSEPTYDEARFLRDDYIDLQKRLRPYRDQISKELNAKVAELMMKGPKPD
jgi:hypothetical protein